MTDTADATQLLRYPLVPTAKIADTGFTIGCVLERLLGTNAEFRKTVSGRKIMEACSVVPFLLREICRNCVPNFQVF